MTWEQRLREAAYTPPSGSAKRMVFSYEDVRQAVKKRTTAFDFPDADGTLVQDLGHTGRRYPLRIYFSGADHDLDATAFEALLLETGVGKLEHPMYGAKNVVPFGDITRRDDLKSAANQSVIELTFWETIPDVYPKGQADKLSEVQDALAARNASCAAEFKGTVDISSAAKKVTIKNQYDALLKTAKDGMQKAADAQADVQAAFDAVYDSISTSVDVLIATPYVLAAQTVALVQLPAMARTAIATRLDIYDTLFSVLITGDATADENVFRTRDLYASNYVTSSVVSVVNNQFSTKTEALTAAEHVLGQLEVLSEWREGQLDSLGAIDDGAAYQKLQEAVALTAGYLVEISFTLKQERSVVLGKARTIIDLAAELYGEVDEQLDFLITSNNLTGAEIIELPRGKRIVYYI